ncbi:MAG: Pseudouridine synthase [Candidatus Gottesmanbacteria bacterium GW2011_GWB1_49_7]|uniref:Pseudouridine synthase n=1 Tax=Candidatus Gottesmanbacteria bacterium GW2011_GWB1_49_7 TaxID=1618448 RepID=A0A0G1VYS0_9BACT|nr:MAG: Pseudouridine synthase [Candidatus Gottesmanbacteria bacterium GW2011_GWB1_49_7]
MNITILFEDDALIVINKPPGMVVNRAESVKGETVQDWVEKTYRIFIADRAGIVHRIDKETSGILLVAKTPDAFTELQRQFKERIIKKTYLAIVHGKLVPEEGEINAPVGRLPWNRERFGIVPGGKEAVTKYKIQKYIKDFSIVELYPQSGRTHQIRVHLKYINHPIVGDYLYAGRKTARDDRRWAPRVMLHAWKLTCLHPTTGKTLDFVAPIPDDMSTIIHGHA